MVDVGHAAVLMLCLSRDVSPAAAPLSEITRRQDCASTPVIHSYLHRHASKKLMLGPALWSSGNKWYCGSRAMQAL